LSRNRGLHLTVPLSLNTIIFFVASGVHGALVAGFSNAKTNLTAVEIAWYIVIFFELVGTLGISCIWRKLSFKATHIAERLGLLGLIIIGEGVIGTTKTIIRIMGKNGVYVEGLGQVFCLILIMVSNPPYLIVCDHFSTPLLTCHRSLSGSSTSIISRNIASAP
jgi:hypothetical protein